MTAPIPLHQWIYNTHEWDTPVDGKSVLSHGQAARLVADWFMTGQTVDDGVSPGWVQRVPRGDAMPRVGPQGPMTEHAPMMNNPDPNLHYTNEPPFDNGWHDIVTDGIQITPVSSPDTPAPAPPVNNQPNESMRAE